MKTLIIINDSNQDLDLKVAFDAAITNLGWEMVKSFETSYIKKFDATDDKEIERLVKQDVDSAIVDAEWQDLKFILAILKDTYKVITLK